VLGLPSFCRFLTDFAQILPAITAIFYLRVIRSRDEGFTTMVRSPGAGAGFEDRSAPVASSRLIHAVAASLAIGSLSLCLIVALTVLSIGVTMAMPFPA
jgi:hypothetical protein